MSGNRLCSTEYLCEQMFRKQKPTDGRWLWFTDWLRVASAFHMMLNDAVCMITEMPPIDILAMKWQKLLGAASMRIVEQRENRPLWGDSNDGTNRKRDIRWTYRLILFLEKWMKCLHNEINFYLTLLLTGHIFFRAYFHQYKLEDSSFCPICKSIAENTEHMFFHCPRFLEKRERLRISVDIRFQRLSWNRTIDWLLRPSRRRWAHGQRKF